MSNPTKKSGVFITIPTNQEGAQPRLVTSGEPLPTSEYFVDVALGNIDGVSAHHKFGRNADIDIGGFETIWNGGGFYTGFNATGAEIVTLSSDDAADTAAGTGARTIQVWGLDANYDEITEVVTLLGATLVDTVNSYIRLDRMRIMSAGSGGVNAGAVSAVQKVTTANIFAVMPDGYNSTMISAYTIPADKTAYLTSWGAGLSGRTNADCNVRILTRSLGEVFQVQEEFSIQGAGTSNVNREYKLLKGPYTEKTDMYIEAETDTNNTGVAAFFDILMVDNA